MTWLNAKRWSGRTQRMLGLGCYVNAVAVFSKKTNLPATNIEEWFEYGVNWIRSFGCEPQTISFLGVSGFEDGDGYGYLSAERKIRKRGFDGIPYISVMAAPPPGFRYWEPYVPDVSISIHNSQSNSEHSYSSLCWQWEHDKQELNKEFFQSITKYADKWISVDYARAIQVYSRYLPQSQAEASSFSGNHEFKYKQSSMKGYSTKKAREAGFGQIDFLRDIYPFQILSPVHLSWKMGNGTLKDWIESSSLNGELSLFSKDRWLWEISENKMDSVRNSLAKHNLLTLYLPDMNRILEDYANPS